MASMTRSLVARTVRSRNNCLGLLNIFGLFIGILKFLNVVIS